MMSAPEMNAMMSLWEAGLGVPSRIWLRTAASADASSSAVNESWLVYMQMFFR